MREAGKTRPQRRLRGTQPKNSGFGLSPIQGKLFPRFERSEFQVRDEDEDGPEEAEKTESSATRDQGFEGESQP